MLCHYFNWYVAESFLSQNIFHCLPLNIFLDKDLLQHRNRHKDFTEEIIIIWSLLLTVNKFPYLCYYSFKHSWIFYII